MILCYSFTGNNAKLAARLAELGRVGVVEVSARRPLGKLAIALDLLLDRRPHVTLRPDDFDTAPRLLILAPIWDRHLAHPMQNALRQIRGRFGVCAFASLCGTQRAGQPETVAAEIRAAAGAEPERLWFLPVTALSTPERPIEGMAASNRAITDADLDHFTDEIEAIARWLT